MPSFAIARGAVPARASSDVPGFFSRRGPDVLLAVVIMVLGAAVLAYLPRAFGAAQLAVAGGRA